MLWTGNLESYTQNQNIFIFFHLVLPLNIYIANQLSLVDSKVSKSYMLKFQKITCRNEFQGNWHVFENM